MSAKRIFNISSTQLAAALLTSKQAAHSLLKRFGPDVCGDPDKLFAALADRNASKLRRRLACPGERMVIAARIDALERIDDLTKQIRRLRAAIAPKIETPLP